MGHIKVIIADDSVIYRSQIKAGLLKIQGVEVVATASNGKIAIERVEQNPADLLILDLEMPEMNGIETLKLLKIQKSPVKVLVFSSASKRGADITLEALNLGASDFVAKPSDQDESVRNLDPAEKIRILLQPKIEALFGPSFHQHPAPAADEARDQSKLLVKEFLAINWDLFQPKVLVIGSSTGGPTALERLFGQVKAPFDCPILIAQHMPPLFTASLAERLSRLAGCPAAEAKHGELLMPNRIYVAPGNYHMRLKQIEGQKVTLNLDQGPLIHSVRPSVDALFESTAAIYKRNALGVVLTGMGHDGRDGAIAIKKSQGAVLIQNKESCVVFGMPGAVHEAGAYDKILDLEFLGRELVAKICTEKKGLGHAAS